MHFLAHFCFLSSKPLKRNKRAPNDLKIHTQHAKHKRCKQRLVHGHSFRIHAPPVSPFPSVPLPTPPFSQFRYLPLVPHGSLARLSPALIQRVPGVVERIAIIVRDVGVDHFGFLSLGFLLEMQLVPQPARKAKEMSPLFADC